MLSKAKQNILKIYKIVYSTNTLKKRLYISFTKYITLFISLLFSLNVFAVGDLLNCDNTHNTEDYYNFLHQWIAESTDIIADIDLVYDLARVSLCIGEKKEGIAYLQKSADIGYIPSAYLMGVYYLHNQTFDPSEEINNLEDLDKGIYYYTKGAQIIQSLANYPKGSTGDMEYVESKRYTSYWLFTDLPFIYLNGYYATIFNITNSNEEKEIFYNDTLDALNKIRETAIQCLNRPALLVWEEKRDIIYKAQQMTCNALFKFAEKAYALEEQRIAIDRNCQVPLNECIEHHEVVSQIYQLGTNVYRQINSASRI